MVAQCLASALECNERHGVWGGLTVSQRDELLDMARMGRIAS